MLPYIDVINVMSVNPGFGGQSFIKESLQRIKDLSHMIKEAHLSHEVLIEVDGGINDKTGKLCYEAGARVLVAGNYLYGAKDRNAAYKSLRSIEE
jgi:ribulose-phosphate 3-epimerase